MMHVLVRHKVSDYNRWKDAFDSHLTTRKRAGETGFRVFHNVDDPREVVLLLDWESIEEARKFMTSDELRERHGQSRGGGSSGSSIPRGCSHRSSQFGRLVIRGSEASRCKSPSKPLDSRLGFCASNHRLRWHPRTRLREITG